LLRKTNKVYLTFDDGPQPEITEWVLNLLKQYQIKATFFCVGENVVKHDELFQRIIDDGHAIGNHSMRHERGTRTSLDEYVKSIDEADTHIQSSLFRPPYGRITLRQTWTLRRKYRIVMWSWLSYDYDHSVSIKRILSNAKKDVQGGDILVFHDNIKSFERLKEILPQFLDIVKSKGFSFDVID
jgi:peptidoglycan/xylan/chitin deacetylase (PgdA/CDA1 family)